MGADNCQQFFSLEDAIKITASAIGRIKPLTAPAIINKPTGLPTKQNTMVERMMNNRDDTAVIFVYNGM